MAQNRLRAHGLSMHISGRCVRHAFCDVSGHDIARMPFARRIVICLALVGAAISAYLTLYQLHVIGGVWDPLFGSTSSEAVLTSSLSRALPVPDAALGAVAYLAEAVLAWASGRFFWALVGFAVVLVGLAAAGLILLLTQVLIVHAFCFLCISSAAISLVNLVLGRADIAALRPNAARPPGQTGLPRPV